MLGSSGRCVYVTSPSRTIVFLLLLFLLDVTATVGRKQRSYGNIVVAVSPQIPESTRSDLIAILKNLLTRASTRLHLATRNHTSFENVVFLLPQRPSRSPLPASDDSLSPTRATSYLLISSIPFAQADVRVDLPDSRHGDEPYTQQPRGCGQPGDFVHLTPNFLLDWNHTKDDIGVNRVVQQWVRYRYGVFDERGWKNSTRFPTQYLTVSGEAAVTGCTAPHQWILRPNTSCTANQVLNQECQFEKKENITAISSLLDDEMAETICDDESDSQHVPDAPTQHNALCREKSVWSIIEAHDDFKSNTSTKTQTNSALQPPTFQMAELSPFTAALVIDPHLCHFTVFKKIYSTFTNVIQKFLNEVPATSRIGLILASNDTENGVLGLTNNLADLQSSFHGLCIPPDVEVRQLTQSLNYGYEMIASETSKNLIFFADGRNLTSDVLTSLQSLLERDEDLKLNLITYPSFTSNMQEVVIRDLMRNVNFVWNDIPLSEVTAEECHLESVLEMEEALTNIVNRNRASFHPAKTVVYSHYHNSSANAAEGTFLIGAKGEMTITCYVCSAPQKLVKFKLNGKKKMMKALNTNDVWIVAESIKTASSLSYSVTVTPAAAVAITVTMDNSNEEIPEEYITVEGHVEKNTLDSYDGTNFTVPVIRAFVRRGRMPVSAAFVEAIIRGPGLGKHVTLQLMDSGGGDPDVMSDDGIYSRYFTLYSNQSGIYDVRVQVSDNNGAARVGTNANSSEDQFLPAFSATSYIDNFYIDGKTDTQRDFPPNRIADFQIVASNFPMSTVTFQWTAPGEDLDYGKVTSLELKCSGNRSNILNNSTSNNNSTVYVETWHPSQIGSHLETREWKVVKCGVVLFCVLTGKDLAGHRGDQSNVVSIHCPCPSSSPTTTFQPIHTNDSTNTSEVVSNTDPTIVRNGTNATQIAWTSTTPSTTTEGSTPDIQLSATDIYIISGVAAGVVLVLVLTTLCICCAKNGSPTNKSSLRPRRFHRNPHYHVDIVRRRWSGDMAEDDYIYSHVSLQAASTGHNTPQPSEMTPPPTSRSEPELGRQRRNLVPRSIPVVSSPSFNSDDGATEQSRVVMDPSAKLVPLPVLQFFPSPLPSSGQPSTFRKGTARTLRDYQPTSSEMSESSSNEYHSVDGATLPLQQPQPEAPVSTDNRGPRGSPPRRPPAPPDYESLYPFRSEGAREKRVSENPAARGRVNDSFNSDDDDHTGTETIV